MRPAPPDGLVERRVASPTEERIVVRAGGRDISAVVLLPDGYALGASHPLLLALHNFAGNAEGFVDLMHAQRLRAAGVVVVLPQASGLVSQWQGPGITLTNPARGADGQPVDDIAGIERLLSDATRLYRADPADINLVGFSQGATLALELARRLDARRPASVRRLFLVAGSAAWPLDATLALPGTEIVAYEPGHNGPQQVANFLASEPDEALVMRRAAAAKDCAAPARTSDQGVDTSVFRCADGRMLIRIYEAEGQHAWPGQAAKYDSWLMGEGSRSRVDFTGLMATELERR